MTDPNRTISLAYPDVPANCVTKLCDLIATIESTSYHLNYSSDRIQEFMGQANRAVQEVLNISQGTGAQALAGTWYYSLSDSNQSHGGLSDAASHLSVAAGTLHDNLPSLIAGMNALDLVKKSGGSVPAGDADNVEGVLNNLNSTLNTIGMALDGAARLINKMNSNWPSACATGFVPGGGYYPTFTPHAFDTGTMNMSGSVESELKSPAGQRILSALGKDKEEEAKLLIEYASDNNADLNDVATLLEKGISPDQIVPWLGKGDLKSFITLLDHGVGAERINAWISRGDNIDHIAAFMDNGADTDTAVQLTRSGVDPATVLPLLKEGVSPKTILSMIKSGVAPKNVAGAMETNMTNLIKDSNPKFRLTRKNAINMLNGPEGTYPQVAGSGGQGADINFIDAKTGRAVLAREEKSVTTPGGFASEVKSLPQQLSVSDGNKEAVFQVPGGTNAKSWVGGFLEKQSDSGLAKYKGITITIIDPDGNVLWQGQLTK